MVVAPDQHVAPPVCEFAAPHAAVSVHSQSLGRVVVIAKTAGDPEDVEAVAERVGLRIWNRWRFAQLGPWMVSVGMGTVLGPMLIGLLRRLGMTFDGLSHDYYVLSKGSVD